MSNKLHIVHILIVFSYLFISKLSFPQNEVIRFEHLTIKDGLSQNHVTRILKDSKGFMWFCTPNGLNRYDGKNFKVYKHSPDDPNSLSNNFVQTIYEDKNGILWIGTYGGGLNSFDRITEKFTHYRYNPNKNSISSDYILSIYEDISGLLWIGTSGSGINKFDRKKNQWFSYQNDPDDPNSLSHNVVRAFYEDEAGILWISTDGGGLNTFDKKTEMFTCYKHNPDDSKSLSHDFVLTIIEDEDYNLWFATGGGLNKFYKDSKTFVNYIYDPNDPNRDKVDNLQNLFKSSSEPGVIWITSSYGIYKFDIKKEKFTHYKHDPYDPTSLSTNITLTIYEDESGLVWVSTPHKGVNKFNSAQENIYHYRKEPTNANSLSFNFVTSIYEDKSGILWIGTDGEGLNKFDRKKGVFTHYSGQSDNLNGLSNYKVYSIVEEKPGILWIGTWGGLNRFDTKNNKFTIYKHDPNNPQSLSHNIVLSLHIDKADNLWIATIGGGLNKLILNENEIIPPVFTHYKHNPNDPHSISGNSLMTIYEDHDGFLWVGTEGGLNKFDKNEEKFTHYKNDPINPNSLSHNHVSTIYQDTNGALWIGTEGGGLNKLVQGDNEESPSTFIRYRENDGLSNDYIYGILEDNHQNLWLSTKNGLSKFNPNKVDDKGVAFPSAFKNYYAHDGFQDNEFMIGSYFKNRKGEMFFGGINGFNAFYPDSLKENLTIPVVAITDFKVLNEDYKLDTSITEINQIVLSHDENFISFDFAVLDYTAPKKNNYAYKLDGLDNNWNYVGNRNFAHYTNVSPGDYVFCVKGSNNNGVWNEEGVSIRIIITPPWWQTWWSYTIYACFLVGLIYILRRYELNRQRLKHNWELKQMEAEKYKEIDRMKSRFFANISHEFRTPLTLIVGPAKDISEKTKDVDIKRRAGIIKRNASRLYGLVNQLLDLSKLEAGELKLKASIGNIVSFVKGITLSFESIAERKDITLKVNTTKEEIETYFDKDKMAKILTNILSNAFKFTAERGEVIVAINEMDMKSVAIKVRDTGIGISREEIPKLFDRFYQVDSSQTREHEGTGIGLAHTKELVELHHGTISVDSKKGEWTEFTIELPLGRDHLRSDEIVELIEQMEEETIVDEKEYLSPTTGIQAEISDDIVDDKTMILVVEDNADVREYIKDSLGEEHRIEEAVNGEQGKRKAEEIIPDLIISDIMMPKMDGNELTRLLKNNEKTSHIPVILLTAKSEQESKIEGLVTGADDYLTKPFDTRELLVRIKNLIDQRRKLQEKFRREIIVNPGDITVTSIDEQLLQRAIDTVENNISDPAFDTTTMAKEVGVSRKLLHTKLKALTGQSTGEFIRTLRLKRAAQLLQKGYGNVTQVAYDVGFQNLSYFAKAFRRQFGQSPSQYSSQSLRNDR
jgi:signal transduction histidine kinase/ligand-binding sensor domain-containing protein/DNA-binding response OmpR family regulator